MSKKVVSLLAWIALFQLVSYFIGSLTQQNIANWYQYLNKSPLNPPDLVFPIVWGILYVTIAIAGWWLWINQGSSELKIALIFYSLQVLMNWCWTPIFFHFHLVFFSLIWIITIVIVTLITISLTWKKLKLTSILLIPYCIWLIFASYLNFEIWMLN